MRGKVRYKQPNGIKVEMYWKYNDYRREMSCNILSNVINSFV